MAAQTGTAHIFERDRYVVLQAILRQPRLAQAYRYACKLADSGRMAMGDSQVPDTPAAYGDFFMDGILHDLLPEFEGASGRKLSPAYSYFRVYKNGDSLEKHTDRSACEISATLCLGFEDRQSWPIWIEGPNGATCADLQPGDALLYRGTECAHWREQFQGIRQAQVFLHYVDRNGPHAGWKLDQRSEIWTPGRQG